jgi:hypothetical protein
MFPICSQYVTCPVINLPQDFLGGNSLKKYIIDIYRGEKDKPRSLVGVIEEVGLKGRKGFTDFDELWEILNPVEREPGKREKPGE